ncbi:hypothetical protein ALQ82_200233 [Pseudomonas syringae pv. pisi]|nr:hypothetical protein ALQ82_200233 [Pseudomonas syringae pv. pisi]
MHRRATFNTVASLDRQRRPELVNQSNRASSERNYANAIIFGAGSRSDALVQCLGMVGLIHSGATLGGCVHFGHRRELCLLCWFDGPPKNHL